MSYDNRPGFTPWDDRTLPNVLGADESGRRVAAFAWIERRLAAVLTGAAAAADGPVTDVLARQAAHHEWHATLWTEQLVPAGATLPGDATPDGPAAEVLDLVAGAPPFEQLVGLSRVVLPRLIAAYTYHRTAVGRDLDATGGRWFRLLLDDEHDDRRDLELFVQAQLTSTDAVERAASFQARLEMLFVQSGGLVGPATLGGTPVAAVTEVKG
ncbi:MAG TPA: hypothetical protein VM030_09400 [Acidimicrobiales bacterium]|nr:hypothetical protein [Acidimicrobiales bacterium]